MKIILFGDSLLKNFNKEKIEEFEVLIPQSDIYNCSVGGWDTNDGVKKPPYISKLKPDVVIIGFGTNDSAAWKQVPLDQFLQNIPKIINYFKSSKIIYFLPPPVRPENGHDADHWRHPEAVKQYHDEAKKLLEQQGTIYLDSFSVFESMLQRGESYHIEDGVHLNDYGYEVLTRELASKVKEL